MMKRDQEFKNNGTYLDAQLTPRAIEYTGENDDEIRAFIDFYLPPEEAEKWVITTAPVRKAGEKALQLMRVSQLVNSQQEALVSHGVLRSWELLVFLGRASLEVRSNVYVMGGE